MGRMLNNTPQQSSILAPRSAIMAGRGLAALLGSAVVLSAVLIVSVPVSGIHWCSGLSTFVTPNQGYTSEATNVGIRLTNGGSDSLDVSEILVRFGWSAQTWNWGTMSLGPGASATNTYSMTMASSAGDYTLNIDVRGRATGDFVTETCSFSGTFRVNALPPPPTVLAAANPTTGSTPLTVSFSATVSQGLGPFTYVWTFGDGGTGSGQSVSHTYSQPGTYTVEVIVTDSRSRSASDTVTVTVQSAISGALGTDLGLLLVIALVVVAAIVAVALAMRARRRRAPPQFPAQPLPPMPPQGP